MDMTFESVPHRWIAVTLVILACSVAGSEENPIAPSAVAPAGKKQTDKSIEVEVFANQRFSQADGRAGLCDVYSPLTAAPPHGYPVVIVIHGGGWISGDKWTVEGYSRLLARNGFVAITINYRLAPKYKFPAQVDDVREALLWTSENAEKYSIDLNRLGLFGYSAGGHLSALVAALGDEPLTVRAAASSWPITDSRWNRLPAIGAVFAGGPPCDFRSLPIDNSALAYFLGGSRREVPEVYVAASPAAHVSSSDPATQIIHGEGDLLVPIVGSEQLHKAQQAAGIDSRFERIPKQGHMVTFLNPETGIKMLEFFQEVLADKPNKQQLPADR